MGDVDFLLKIVVRDVDRYQQFIWNELSQIEGVREVSSSISLGQLVAANRLPLDSGAD
jgi:Lrp/AsnC family transcriptional regulator